ncbi:MAG: N-acetyl-gamma-glutamyl-phosphate reductase [Planctomycetota bacterium]|jgi:N-acetyl-gamma-glutamyl-phosphate reductase
MSHDTTLRAAIVGGTGYGGMELLRWLLQHPDVELTAITSRTETGKVGEVHGHLRGFTELAFTEARATDLAQQNDVLFFATPHGVCAKEAPDVLDASPTVKVIDLSGDWRLESGGLYAEHYGQPHPHAERLGEAVYGAAECGARDALAGARLVANPGCHAIATLLAIWPLADAGLVSGRVSVASVTGSSGSGASPGRGTHHPERFGNFKAYRPLRHQHLPEILGALHGDVAVDFVPHSAPFARGIHVTAFVPVGDGNEESARATMAARFADEPFVRVVDGSPEVRSVVGTNFADVGITAADGVACVTVAIDNLGKGMAGSAVQNMNLACGLPETTGLMRPGLGL